MRWKSPACSTETVRNLDRSGRLRPVATTSKGLRLYTEDDVAAFKRDSQEASPRREAVHA
jgi:DNA-binding transcriptional MerR regulator